jgi:amino acid adenylation domain-containing protein
MANMTDTSEISTLKGPLRGGAAVPGFPTVSDASNTSFDPFAGPLILATAPSTEPQREIWTACALGDDASLAFNESITVRLQGQLDVASFRAALTELIARHEALRTTLSGDGLTLCVGSPFDVALIEHDLSGPTAEDAENELVRLAQAEVGLPFDLSRGPLFRAHLARLPGSADGAGPNHALIFTAHHIVCDGWSTAVLMRDLAALYNARSKDQVPALAAPDAFSAYALGRAQAPGTTQQQNEEYWVKQFPGDLPILDLPIERSRPARKTYNAGREDAVLQPELVTALRKAGAKLRASLFATLLAGFKSLVHRLSGQEDLVIGIPVAGQAFEDRPELVGHCVNMLPLRSSVRSSEPFSQLLGRVRKTLLDAQEHQDFTFGKLLTKLPIARDPSRLPLVSVIFNVDRGMTSDAIGFDGIRAELKANARTHENFELFLNAVEIDGRVELEAQYNSDLFDAQVIRRWLESYRLLLASIAENPDAEVGALAVVSDGELLQLSAWNATDAAYDREACVHDLVLAAARRTPAKVAIEFAGASISYGELDARGNRLARRLRAAGVRRGALVGLCLERGLELVVGLLAIHKAGAAYVPLDPGYPKERLAFMVQDSAMRVLVTDSALERELAFEVAQVVCVDREQEALRAEPADALPFDADSATPESPAYVIYTSGSTGKPKGVLVPHRAVVSLLGSVAKRPGLTDADVVLAITTLSFDIAVSEIWLPLVVGATIVMASREVAADGAQLKELCEQKQVTFIDATPATYRLLLAAGWRGNPGLKLICTGEAMPKDLALELPRCAGSVWNGYGPTETTVWSTFWQVPENTTRVLIGQPVDNTRIHILDAQLRRVPLGVSGELYIAGDGVTLGYWNRPELTRDRFVADPFDSSGKLMYRTGDVGRYLSNGDIECLGRNDNQVKLRGFRIELGEIEDALLSHTAIAEAAVILREDRPGDARLVGYVVTSADGAPPNAELRQHLQRTLPDYMVPATYVTLPRMPLTPSGKIDRRALPAPEANADDSGAVFVAPRTPTETLLAELWAAALNVARVSIHDDFFALGGHSLLASQILARLRRDHGIELSFRRFFEAPSVARLAELIDGAPVAERAQETAIAKQPAGTSLQLSLAQERLWLLEEMHPAQRLVHNLPAAWRIKGPLDLQLLQQSLDRVAERQQMMHMALRIDGNRATQRIAEKVSLKIDPVDLRAEPAEAREAVMFERIRQLTAEPFELTRAPLFRSTLFRLDDAEYVYFTVRHNIIWDGWSFDVFVSELCTIYSALERGTQPVLPELAVSYPDYAAWHREWVKGPALAEQIKFWQERLSGDVPDLSLPLDHYRPAQTQHAGANLAMPIARADADALTAVAHRAGTTLFNLLYAAYSVVLHRFSGQREIVVGTPVRARNLPEVESLIGPFINAVVLRSTIDPREPFLDYVARVRDMTLDAFSNQDMPLELLGTRPPVVRAFFSFQDAKARPSFLGSASLVQVDVEPPAAANDLMLWLMDRPHELLAVANFSTEIFEPRTIQRLLRSLLTLLRDVATNPTRAVGELALLSVEDQRELSALTTLDDEPPVSVLPAYNTLIERARSAPNAVAFSAPERDLRYDELLGSARAIAQAVAERVGPDAVVAVVADSPTDFVSLALGVWLAGCVVLPIVSAAPEPYRARLLQAGAPELVLASGDRATSLATALSVPVLDAAGLSPLDAWVNSRGAGASGRAWLRVSFESDASARLVPLSHAELGARVRSLVSLVGRGSTGLVAWADALNEELPLSLLLGAALGVPSRLVDSEASLATQISAAAEAGGAPCVLAPAARWSVLLSAGMSGQERMTALVHGYASAELLAALTPGVKYAAVLQASSPPESVLFGTLVHSPHDAQVLGRPLGLSSVTVLDASGGAVPVGVVGELSLEGTEGQLLGLQGRWRSDRRLELISAGSTLLVDGQRFSPGDVARTLEKHAAVKEAAVKQANEHGQARLVAYFASKPGVDFTDTELRRHVRGHLPEAMVPQLFIEVPSLPRTATGSIDEAALPAPFGGFGHNDYAAPRNDNESLVAELYAEALGMARVSIYDNFFDLGGHSLLCFRVIERIEQRIGKRLSPRTILLGSLEQVAAELPQPGVAEPASVRAPASVRTPGPPSVRTPASPPENASVTGRVFKKLTGLLKR